MHFHEQTPDWCNEDFLKEEIKVFWEKPEHIAVHQKGEATGHLFGLYLFPHCSLDSKRPGYVFTIKNEEVMFCINTITKIFGLGQHAKTAARLLHVDQKAIGLNLLKKACWLDMKKNPDHRHLYRNYHTIFKHQIVPMSHNNPQAIQLIDVLGGLMIDMDQPCLDAIDFINDNYHPMFEELTGVSNGGDNIRYGFPGNGLPKWKSFDEIPELQALPKKFNPILMEYWENKEEIVYSVLGDTKDNIVRVQTRTFWHQVLHWVYTHSCRWNDASSLDRLMMT